MTSISKSCLNQEDFKLIVDSLKTIISVHYPRLKVTDLNYSSNQSDIYAILTIEPKMKEKPH